MGKRKNTRVYRAILAAVICLIIAPVSAQQKTEGSKILIVYLSRTKNTEAVARIIQQKVGGTLLAIEPAKPYPADYQATVAQVARENETGYLPPLKTRIDDMGRYDVVFIGFPTWGMQLPPPVKSFLKQYNLAGKKVLPFNTHAGYGAGNSFSAIKEACAGSTVAQGFSTKGGVERDGVLLTVKGTRETALRTEVNKWLQITGML